MDPGWGNLGVRQEIDSGREGGWGDTRPEQRQRSECILLTENFEAFGATAWASWRNVHHLYL